MDLFKTDDTPSNLPANDPPYIDVEAALCEPASSQRNQPPEETVKFYLVNERKKPSERYSSFLGNENFSGKKPESSEGTTSGSGSELNTTQEEVIGFPRYDEDTFEEIDLNNDVLITVGDSDEEKPKQLLETSFNEEIQLGTPNIPEKASDEGKVETPKKYLTVTIEESPQLSNQEVTLGEQQKPNEGKQHGERKATESGEPSKESMKDYLKISIEDSGEEKPVLFFRKTLNEGEYVKEVVIEDIRCVQEESKQGDELLEVTINKEKFYKEGNQEDYYEITIKDFGEETTKQGTSLGEQNKGEKGIRHDGEQLETTKGANISTNVNKRDFMEIKFEGNEEVIKEQFFQKSSSGSKYFLERGKISEDEKISKAGDDLLELTIKKNNVDESQKDYYEIFVEESVEKQSDGSSTGSQYFQKVFKIFEKGESSKQGIKRVDEILQDATKSVNISKNMKDFFEATIKNFDGESTQKTSEKGEASKQRNNGVNVTKEVKVERNVNDENIIKELKVTEERSNNEENRIKEIKVTEEINDNVETVIKEVKVADEKKYLETSFDYFEKNPGDFFQEPSRGDYHEEEIVKIREEENETEELKVSTSKITFSELHNSFKPRYLEELKRVVRKYRSNDEVSEEETSSDENEQEIPTPKPRGGEATHNESSKDVSGGLAAEKQNENFEEIGFEEIILDSESEDDEEDNNAAESTSGISSITGSDLNKSLVATREVPSAKPRLSLFKASDRDTYGIDVDAEDEGVEEASVSVDVDADVNEADNDEAPAGHFGGNREVPVPKPRLSLFVRKPEEGNSAGGSDEGKNVEIQMMALVSHETPACLKPRLSLFIDNFIDDKGNFIGSLKESPILKPLISLRKNNKEEFNKKIRDFDFWAKLKLKIDGSELKPNDLKQPVEDSEGIQANEIRRFRREKVAELIVKCQELLLMENKKGEVMQIEARKQEVKELERQRLVAKRLEALMLETLANNNFNTDGMDSAPQGILPDGEEEILPNGENNGRLKSDSGEEIDENTAADLNKQDDEGEANQNQEQVEMDLVIPTEGAFSKEEVDKTIADVEAKFDDVDVTVVEDQDPSNSIESCCQMRRKTFFAWFSYLIIFVVIVLLFLNWHDEIQAVLERV